MEEHMKTFHKFLLVAFVALASALATGCHLEPLPAPPGLPAPVVPVPGP
jgi:hypothetical protein